jgi:hypothetical protein
MGDEAPNIGEAVEQISTLLRGEPGGSPDPDPPSSREAAPTTDVPSALAPPASSDAGADELTPTAIAEKLGIKPDKFFKGLKIPIDDGEPLTLEEFKGAGKELRGLKAAQHELAEEKVTFENSVMLQKQTLEKTLAKIPAELLTPEMVSEVQAEHRETIDRERSQLHTIRPDLKDPAKWNATRELLITHLAPYGFHRIEVDSIIDHRLAKYVIDNAEREQRIKNLDADSLQPEKTGRRPSQKPAPGSQRAQQKTGGKTRDKQAEQVSAIADLIVGANK